MKEEMEKYKFDIFYRGRKVDTIEFESINDKVANEWIDTLIDAAISLKGGKYAMR